MTFFFLFLRFLFFFVFGRVGVGVGVRVRELGVRVDGDGGPGCWMGERDVGWLDCQERREDWTERYDDDDESTKDMTLLYGWPSPAACPPRRGPDGTGLDRQAGRPVGWRLVGGEHVVMFVYTSLVC
jgi:hypothetical protein